MALDLSGTEILIPSALLLFVGKEAISVVIATIRENHKESLAKIEEHGLAIKKLEVEMSQVKQSTMRAHQRIDELERDLRNQK